MQDDMSLDDIYQELKSNETKTRSERKTELGQRLVSDLISNADMDISLGEYLKLGEVDSVSPGNKLIGLLDDLEKETDMEEEIDEMLDLDLDDEDELEGYDLSGIRTKQRQDIEKNLFINHKKRVRQSGPIRIKSYANTNARLTEESELRPLSLKRYNS